MPTTTPPGCTPARRTRASKSPSAREEDAMSRRIILIALLASAGCVAGMIEEGNSVDVEATLARATVRPVTLKTALKGKFVVAENNGGGAVNADRDVASTWETFKLYDLNAGELTSGDEIYLAAGN